MTTETTVLTDDEIERVCRSMPPYPTDAQFARAIEQAVLQSPEIQELRNLLKDARQQLPLAAQFWNEDDEPERGSRNVQRVMKLIAKIDALLPSTPARPESEQ